MSCFRELSAETDSMIPDQRIAARPTLANGTFTALVRLMLALSAMAIFLAGIYHLPEIATTHGELVFGILLSLAVAAQILVAALLFPMSIRRR